MTENTKSQHHLDGQSWSLLSWTVDEKKCELEGEAVDSMVDARCYPLLWSQALCNNSKKLDYGFKQPKLISFACA